MTEEEIRKKYQRDDSDPRGKNDRAIDKFINMINAHKTSDNEHIRRIANNIRNLEQNAPNFTIFESEESTFYMHHFSALQINPNEDDLVLSHEFGHAVLGTTKKTQVPPDFEQIVKGARANCIKPENKEKFREFIVYISDKNNQDRTEAEKGPVSDIISSIFQYPVLAFAKTNQECVLPSYHMREYYFDEEKGQMKANKIFDEDFANLYTLLANNCSKEIEILKTFLGEEWMQTMMDEIKQASKLMENPIKKTITKEEDNER